MNKSEIRSLDDLRQATTIFTGSSTDAGDYQYQNTSSTLSSTDTSTDGGEHGLDSVYGEPISYDISSIAIAMFLVLTFAGSDLRGSWALLQTRRPYNIALGLTILVSFILLVMASMKTLFFLADDDVSFIVGAATVLFISDLVRKWRRSKL